MVAKRVTLYFQASALGVGPSSPNRLTNDQDDPPISTPPSTPSQQAPRFSIHAHLRLTRFTCDLRRSRAEVHEGATVIQNGKLWLDLDRI